MYNYKTKTFIFKNQMVEYIADYYSNLGNALSDAEYDELESIYGKRPTETEKELIGEFKDFQIYRNIHGDWEIKRAA